MKRTGLGRHGRIDDASGDPLDGLVNLFDIGIVLAVAFLIAGLGLTTDPGQRAVTPTPASATGGPAQGEEQVIPDPANAPEASGRGEAVGQVYRLADGSLIFVEDAVGGEPGTAAEP